jgi:hypothetical protein
MPVMVNPSGTVYNPASVCDTLDMIIAANGSVISDLQNNNGTWFSFRHSTGFSSEDPGELLNMINVRNREALKFLSGTRFLVVTFGTARVYRWKQTGEIVSNCHKLPSASFLNEMLSVEDIVRLWNNQLSRLMSLFPEIKVIFTVSPVRHWKDGAHDNQVSKSVLFLAIEELLKHPSAPDYFPSYEIVMDDLRDYRFYEDDMLHPSPRAVDYIWNAFAGCFLDKETVKLRNEVEAITRAAEHRISNIHSKETALFASNMLEKIDRLAECNPSLCLGKERNYFTGLLKF